MLLGDMTERKTLTLKQQRFINEFIANGGNGTQAALKAYNPKNANTAHAIAADNLRKPTVSKAIEEILKPEEADRGYVLKGIVEMTRSDNEPIRLKALELLGKVHRMFTDRVDHTHVFETIKSIGWSAGAGED